MASKSSRAAAEADETHFGRQVGRQVEVAVWSVLAPRNAAEDGKVADPVDGCPVQ